MSNQEMSNFYYNKGLQLFNGNRVSKAVIELEKSFSIDENNYENLNLLGLCYYTLGEFYKSKFYWELSRIKNENEDNKALKYLNDINSSPFLEICDEYNKALELCSNDKWYEGAKKLEKVPYDSFVSFCNLYGLCRYAENQNREAVKQWKKALELDKDNKEANNYLIEITEYIEDKGFIFKKIKRLFTKD
ncbi:hypothetical protein [Clostridium sp. DL1XJH146]